ncbi:MAG: SDR family NAD(P)-dependent oxidoreductase [Chitinophagales bacterium]|nr:SDR family NAD(P)-dependent oxidoreductase [Chitinophagales bacterium]
MNDLKHRIAVVGMACIYPDADNYMQLWENILSKRRAFRKVPDCRLSSAYFNPEHPDAVYMNIAAVIKNYDFDRAKFHISGSSFRTADIAHWIALETADNALRDSGLDISDLPLSNTGVFVGNTLTGETTRSNQLRLRWPYIAKTIAKEFQDLGWSEKEIEVFLRTYEQNFKAPFAQMEEDSLAGGLSNTIAGRICNYFDIKGGGYTVDGACSSSLLSIIEACQAIESGSLKVAIAGGVDISLDPFELVGFSRTGALAKKEMSVYDKNANGFWPGEGCGFVLLMDYEEAVNRSLNIYTVINGWGISSDGQGGITRPTIDGQLLAMEKAYKKAGYDIDQVPYIEGHGTGTKVGDEVELGTIKRRLQDCDAKYPSYVGSVKSNIGHAKAAAGIAGFIKAVLAVKNQLIPPVSGLKHENNILASSNELNISQSAMLWDHDRPLKASISAMGFGGINTHITIENPTGHRRSKLTDKENQLISSYQDAEVFIFTAKDVKSLSEKLGNLLATAPNISFSEMSDLACKLYDEKQEEKRVRIAFVANKPKELERKLHLIIDHLNNENTDLLDTEEQIFINIENTEKRIGLMFPGQGIDMKIQGELFQARFPKFDQEIKRIHELKNSSERVDTAIVQPMSTLISKCGIDLLKLMNVEAERAVGHSLGEIPALYWAEVIDGETMEKLAKTRGELINEFAGKNGAMLSINTDLKTVFHLIGDSTLKVAVVNGENHFVLSGEQDEVERVYEKAQKEKVTCFRLKVDHAFHSPLMEGVRTPFERYLYSLDFQEPQRKMISSVTATEITSKTDCKQVLIDQLTFPVKFHNAIMMASKDIDVWIDMGSNAGLKAIVSRFSEKPILTLGTFADSFEDLLTVSACSFAFKETTDLNFLFENRFRRELDIYGNDTFITNPCETADSVELIDELILTSRDDKTRGNDDIDWQNANGDLPLLFRRMLAERLELPIETISEESKMLDDLHLNSITVSEIVTSTAKLMGVNIPSAPTEYANASVGEICSALNVLSSGETSVSEENEYIEGIEKWVESFMLDFRPETLEIIPARKTHKVSLFNFSEKYNADRFYTEDPTFVVSLVGLKEDRAVKLLLAAFAKASELKTKKILILQNKPLANGFAKSFHLENPATNVKIVELSSLDDIIIEQELNQINGFEEILYDGEIRKKAYLRLKEIQSDNLLLEEDDVVLVSGGGKGITAECALALAREYGVRLAIMGRSDPTKDVVLSNNLERFKKHGVDCLYLSVDVTDADAVRETLEATSRHFGKISVVVHGAGVNIPCQFALLDENKVKETLNPKFYGLRNILKSLSVDELKYVFTFGSIISESGMAGNADYALANQWMANYLKEFQSKNRHIKCSNLAWSVWSGIGMGEKLNVLESLMKNGIEPITIEQGVASFLRVIRHTDPYSNFIISSRVGKLKTVHLEDKDKPLLRFLDDIKVFYPGVELISECEINYQNDPYLADHEIDGLGIFPTVMGLEAIQQLILILVDQSRTTTFSNIKLKTAISIPPDGSERLRFIVQRVGNNKYKGAIRRSSNGFIDDCFTMDIEVSKTINKRKEIVDIVEEDLQIQADELYGNLLFHKGRFQVIESYKIASAYECMAVLGPLTQSLFYGDYLPQKITGNDPAVRDAILHAVQVCVPYKTLLPVEISSIKKYRTDLNVEAKYIHAKESSHDKDSYVYNIFLLTSEGHVLEEWTGVVYRSMRQSRPGLKMNTCFSRNYIRRILDDHAKSTTAFSFTNGIVPKPELIKRPDGKPELSDHLFIAKSKSGNYSISIESNNPVGCDLQKVADEEKSWVDLIGSNRYEMALAISENTSITTEEACYRIWGIVESFKKAGMPLDSPFTLVEVEDGNILFNSGEADILSLVLPMKAASYVLTILEMDRIQVPGAKTAIDEKVL